MSEARAFKPNSYFDDLRLGDSYVTGRRTVTESDLVAFSGLSGDFSALHTDEVFAKAGPFGRRIAHGCLTLSIATGLEYSLMGDNQDKILAFYGMEHVRFTAPVFIGDTIHIEAHVTALDEKDNYRGIVTVHQEIKKQNGKTVASLDKRTLNKKRPQ